MYQMIYHIVCAHLCSAHFLTSRMLVIRGAIAQRLEQWTDNPEVDSLNPACWYVCAVDEECSG